MSPLSIYQDAVNVVSSAVLAGDFPAFIVMFDLPYLMHTDSQRVLTATEAELRAYFQTLHHELKSRGVTHYERVAREADYVARDRIQGWHFTHQIADGVHVAPQHTGRETLVLRGDRWLFSESYYPTQTGPWPGPEIHVDPAFEVRK
jgi:hypothetical protein